MVGSIHSLPDEVLAAHILARLPRPHLCAACPWDQVCRRWRHVYSHSPVVWQAADSKEACADNDQLADKLSNVPHGPGNAQQREALQTWLAIARRRAPALRALMLSTGFMMTPPHQLLPSLVDFLQLFAASQLETLRVSAAATPGTLQLLAAHQGATLTCLDWSDARTRSDWAAAGPHLAGLAALRKLSVSLGTRRPPAGLLSGIQQLRGLRELGVVYHPDSVYGDLEGESEQEQQQEVTKSMPLDLGFLAGSAATLGYLLLALPSPLANIQGHPPPAIILPAALASQLTAMTHLVIAAMGWSVLNGSDVRCCQNVLCCGSANHLSSMLTSTLSSSIAHITNAALAPQVKGLGSLSAIIKVTLVGLESEGAQLWHASTVQSLHLFRSPFEGPPSVGFDAFGCQLESLCCIDCTMPKRGFPEPLCHLPLLTQLELVKCKLDNLLEPLPRQLTELPLLVYLSLDGNALDQVPAVVPQLTHLIRLNLNNNRLSELPENMKSMRSLAMLELAGNQLAEYPSVLYYLHHIALLDLSNNPLRPTDLDGQCLDDSHCFWESVTDTCWLFMGKDSSSGVEDANHWTSDDMNAAVKFAKMLPSCELRLGDSQRPSIIASEWEQHFRFWRHRRSKGIDCSC